MGLLNMKLVRYGLRKHACLAALALTVLSGGAAFATPYIFKINDGAFSGSFKSDSNAAPGSNFSLGTLFTISVTNGTGYYAGYAGNGSFTFFSADSGGAFNNYYGPVLYTGPEDHATFTPGSYSLIGFGAPGSAASPTLSIGPSGPAPQIGLGWLSALAAALALAVTRAQPFRRKATQG